MRNVPQNAAAAAYKNSAIHKFK